MVFTAPDARVLIVDDMPINLKIVEELLRPLSMQLDEAENGREALNKIYAGHYDIVLMDHMMPVMDGVEAITELRARPEEKYRSLPVVVLTSNATDEEKTLFFESGFSDFLPKPINPEDTFACIRRWLPPERILASSVPSADGSASDTPDFDAEECAINIPGIDVRKGIENSGNPVLFKELLGDVYELIDDKCASIRTHLADGQIKSYTTEVHALKTTCRMIGAMTLSEDFYTLEKLGTKNRVSELKELTPRILSDFSALKPYLKPYATAPSAEPDREYDKKDVLDVFERLEAAIDDFDQTAADRCTDTLSSYVFDERLSAPIQNLCELVTNLDYDEAVDRIREVRKLLG